MHDVRYKKTGNLRMFRMRWVIFLSLREAKVRASSGNSGEHLLAKRLVAFVFRKIELYFPNH